MPPKRRSTRTAQLHPQPIQSDYDTETVDATETAPTFAPPPQRTNTELNLTVLRRHCPAIEQIVCIAPFAVIYTFSPDSQQWEKCGIEGTLFTCKLSGGRFNVVILNRKSLDNFVVELVSADDVEITEQYVILQSTGEDGVPQIYGLWIFTDEKTVPTREVIAQTIHSCAMQAQIAREAKESSTTDGQAEEYAEYGVDGTAQIQEQVAEEEAVAQGAGQRVDLLQLFGSAAPEPTNMHNMSAQPIASPSPQALPSATVPPMRFSATPDTDFFRSTSGFAPSPVPTQQRAPSTQQNALLGLFKSGR